MQGSHLVSISSCSVWSRHCLLQVAPIPTSYRPSALVALQQHERLGPLSHSPPCLCPFSPQGVSAKLSSNHVTPCLFNISGQQHIRLELGTAMKAVEPPKSGARIQGVIRGIANTRNCATAQQGLRTTFLGRKFVFLPAFCVCLDLSRGMGAP